MPPDVDELRRLTETGASKAYKAAASRAPPSKKTTFQLDEDNLPINEGKEGRDMDQTDAKAKGSRGASGQEAVQSATPSTKQPTKVSAKEMATEIKNR